ncbi:MAG: sensor histidine kinase, partial [Alphaproteobacteria bacterium]
DILHSGQHLLSLINDILDLSRIESGKQTLQEEAINLDELLQSTIRLVRGRAGDKNQRLHIQGESNITFFADSRAIRQIIANLLSNAIKFTPENGNIELGITIDNNLSIAIRDSGRGIEKHQLAKLFQPFNRGQEDAARTEEGAGLGLAISRKLARLHGGDLELHSEPGTGTTALLTLPLERLIGGAQGILPWEIRT